MPTTSRTIQTTHRRHQQTNNTLIYSHSTAQRILRYTYWPKTCRRIETHQSLFSLSSQLHLGSTDSRPITSRISWPMTSTTGVLIVSTDVTQVTWLWRWLSLRLSKRQSMSSQTVLLRTTLTRTIVLYFMIWLLGSNHLQFLLYIDYIFVMIIYSKSLKRREALEGKSFTKNGKLLSSFS